MKLSDQAQKMIQMNKEMYVPVFEWKNADYQTMRRDFEAMMASQKTAEGTTWRDDIMNGVPVERVFVPGASEKRILYIHGGGMKMGSPAASRFMVTHVGSRCKRNVVGVNYRLSPEYAQPAAVEDCAAVYRALLDEVQSPGDIAFLGESAGGMLVFALLAYIKKNGLPMPGCACAISGSVDMNYQSQSMTRNRATEMVVNWNLAEEMAATYYKGGDPRDPVLSPIYSDLTGWPPVYMHVCKEEILEDESIRMYVKLQEAGVETELTIIEGLFHTYMMLDMPESYDAFEQIASFFSKH